MFDALLIAAVAAVALVIIGKGQGLIGALPRPLPQPLRQPVPRPLPQSTPAPERARAPEVPQPAAPPRPSGVRRIPRVRSLAMLPARSIAIAARILRRLDVRRAIRPAVLHDRRVIGSAVVVAVSAFVWFVWPTPYRELPVGSGGQIGAGFEVVALRQQRLTGRVDALVKGAGWVCLVGCHSALASAGD